MQNRKEQEIQENIRRILSNFSQPNFIYDLLSVYNPRSSVERVRKGSYNQSKNEGEIIWKKKLFFREAKSNDLYSSIEQLRKDLYKSKYDPRFIIFTDYKTLVSIDTKTSETLDIPIQELDQYYEFFYPWAGREKIRQKPENFADIKAAEKMAKLYDAIKKDNPNLNDRELHALNVFFSRLLFCFFSESTEIFEKGLFTNTVASHTSEDGTDLNQFLLRLFDSLDIENKSSHPKFIQKFPYVNGRLFAEKFPIPQFSRNSRKILLECGGLNWSSINPDIFGSMIQAVVSESQRSSMGMHYTSVANIMKVIAPLFLDELNDEFKKSSINPKKLHMLLQRLSNIRIFDPACGSGNFLIIAYKELRELEIKILKRLNTISKELFLPLSGIFLTQFYGIELDDFTHEIAILSLWLAEHQMNVKFKETFGESRPSLPLKQGGNIVCGNAARLDWEKVCPKNTEFEIHILGNPPYLGSSMQNKQQKEDLAILCKGFKNFKNLDYIACWFIKASNYVQNLNTQVAFVSTNSLCQGEQVSLLWPYIFEKNLEISFAYRSFKWTNNTKGVAGVTCNIIGLRIKQNKETKIYNNDISYVVKNLTPYLTEGSNIIIPKSSRPISNIQEMVYGNKSTDGGHLFFEEKDNKILIKKHPKAKHFIKPLVGSSEFIKGNKRYCLWIEDKDLKIAKEIPLIKERLEKVKNYRKASKAVCTVKFAAFPHRFKQITYAGAPSIVIPRVSSERRLYIPFGFLDPNTIILDSAEAIYDPETYVFGVISSRMHMTWVKAIAGRLGTTIRYSSTLCYNTFPFPDISKEQKDSIATHVYNVISEREKHPEKTIAELYDPESMPAGLKEAHKNLDKTIERCYRSKPFTSDEERLEYLFKLYEEMTKNEKKEKAHAKSC